MTFTPTPTAPPGDPTYTPIPPFVAMVAPCPNTHDAGCDTFETVTLNSPPDPASLTPGNHVLHSGMQSLTSGTFAVNGNSYTFAPDMLFHPGELVTTTVTEDVTVMGLPVAPFIWQFRTAAQPAQGVFEDTGDTIPGWGWPADAELGDVDADGDLDVVFAYTVFRGQVYLNNGSGGFSQGAINLQIYDCQGVELGDLDGDGDLDFFFVTDGHANGVWFNDGSGNYSDSGQVLGGDDFNFDVALGDLDGDGDLDAFVAKNSRNHVFVNDGLGYFTQHAILPNLAYSRGIALGDVDGDGDLDGYAANIFEQDRLWLNDGLANFTDSGQTLCNKDSSSVAFGDLDGDGDLDAAIGTFQNQANSIWLNDGTGVFTDSGQTLETANTYEIDLGDVDGDGDLDILSSNYLGQNRIWLNDGWGVFSSSQIFPQEGTRSACFGDLDGDGDLDILEAISTGDPTRIWLNLDLPPCIRHGDMTLDGSLTAADAQMVFNTVLGLITPTYEEACAADCNGSGTITAADAQTIFYAVLGMGEECVDPL